jgi:hypothetical protein
LHFHLNNNAHTSQTKYISQTTKFIITITIYYKPQFITLVQSPQVQSSQVHNIKNESASCSRRWWGLGWPNVRSRRRSWLGWPNVRSRRWWVVRRCPRLMLHKREEIARERQDKYVNSLKMWTKVFMLVVRRDHHHITTTTTTTSPSTRFL